MIATVVRLLAGALLATGCAGAAGSVSTAPPPPRRDDVGARRDGPHESVRAFLDSHFSADEWNKDVVDGYLATPSVLLPVGLALGAGAIAPWDHTISEHARDSDPFFGNATLATLLVGTAAVGVFAPGEGRDGAEERWAILEAFALDLTTTEALKAATGRRRPNGGSKDSFTSAHTSLAFTAATLIDRNSGHALGIPAYALAVATGVARVESRRHFPSDVFAGAAIGALSAGVVDSLHFGGDAEGEGISRRRSASAEVGLDIGPDGRPGVALTIRF
jgi:membrane-associated phospholipid phosphatase